MQETEGVFVATFGDTTDFPAFYSRKSGCHAPYSVETAAEAAKIIHWNRTLNLQSGMLFAVPVPEQFSFDENVINDVIAEALEDAKRNGIRGKEITPFLLGRIGEITAGKSLETSILRYRSQVTFLVATGKSGNAAGCNRRTKKHRGLRFNVNAPNLASSFN